MRDSFNPTEWIIATEAAELLAVYADFGGWTWARSGSGDSVTLDLAEMRPSAFVLVGALAVWLGRWGY